MKLAYKISYMLFICCLFSSCNDKKSETKTELNPESKAIHPKTEKESVEGIYETQSEGNESDDCVIRLELSKIKDGYSFFFKTKIKNIHGRAHFTTDASGEKYLVLEGMLWDEYEGDVSDQEDSDSESNSKELEAPVGIEALYVEDTLTIQNYGNSMNSYTKISECDRKYIQLIKK